MIRIASLLPSTTEIVCALGMEQALVGRSHECDHPTGITGLPVLTAARLDASRSSREIDDAVKDLVRRAVSIYDVDAGLLRELRPDVILTQTQCEVCAVSEADVARAVADWTGTSPQIVSLEPNALESVWATIGRVAEVLGERERGEHLMAAIRQRVADVAQRAAGSDPPPRVACIEWIDPLMTAGNWVPELVGFAGGINLFSRPGAHSPWLEWDELESQDPDVIVVMPCGFGIERCEKEMAVLHRNKRWNGLRAVREGRVYLTDGNHYFNRPGPRLVDSLEILAEILHPARFPAVHRGVGWVVDQS